MSAASNYTIALNNYLQALDPQAIYSLSWLESVSGPDDAPVWTMTCKISGEVKGTATASHKNAAKNQAAKQALQALGQPV